MAGFEIDPKVATILQIGLQVATLVGNGTLTLTGLVTPQQAVTIQALCSLVAGLLGAIMSAFSSSEPGPLAPQDPAVVVAAQKLADLPANASALSIITAKAAATQAVENHTARMIEDEISRREERTVKP